MDSIAKIRELLGLMDENDLVELEMEEDEFKVKLRKPSAMAPTMVAAPAVAAAAAPVVPAQGAPAQDDPNLTPIPSPIVGTFYRAPSPDADVFVNEGSTVGQDSVVCIIEAMKIMNEIKAGVSGTIERICVENGEPVEYGQTLFLVRK